MKTLEPKQINFQLLLILNFNDFQSPNILVIVFIKEF